MVCLLYFVYSALGPIRYGVHATRQSVMLQHAHALGLALYSYANDYSNTYPDGGSSTEVFQKLLDGGYVTDPALFYIPMPGKVRPVAGQKLKAENVSFDVTGGVTLSDPGELPLVFTTGYHLTFAPGTDAVPVLRPYPKYLVVRHTFLFMTGPPAPADPGIGVFYVANNAVWINASTGPIPNVVKSTFNAKGKTFRQLTPDGVLPP